MCELRTGSAKSGRNRVHFDCAYALELFVEAGPSELFLRGLEFRGSPAWDVSLRDRTRTCVSTAACQSAKAPFAAWMMYLFLTQDPAQATWR